jgi:zinc protease
MPHPTSGLIRETLANGVTLLVQRRRTAPAASLVCHIRAGFLDEPDQVVGISHVLEHMLFKGTPSLGPGELARRTKSLGGTLNAYTSYDRTVYYASVPARHASELIALQADQVRNASLDADELRRELGVIIQEARRKLDSPGAVVGETLHELLYANHRLRRWRIGTEALLERFTRDDVAAYYHDRYTPSCTIVSFIGDVDERAALDMLRSRWSDWTRAAVAVPAGPAEQGTASVQARRLTGDVALGDVVLGWRAPGVLDTEIPAFDLASAILGLGRGSRFSRLLRDTGLVNSVGVGSYGVVDAGVFSIGIELDPVRLRKTLQVIGSTIRDLAAQEPGTAEFGRALTMLRSRLGRRLERYESRAIALADAESFGDVTRLDRDEGELLAVTPAMVRDVMRRWIVPQGVSGVAYLPRESDVQFDMGVLQNAMDANVILSEATAEPLRSRRTSVSGEEASPGARNRGPSTAALRTFAQDDEPSSLVSRLSSLPPSIHHVALPAVDILTARFGETGQTSLNLYRPRDGGTTPGTAGLAALAVRSMVRGTARYDASELAFAMESLGGSVGFSHGADLLGFGATVLSEHVGRAAGILLEVLQQPRFDPETIAIERGVLLDDARAVADDMVRFPVQLAMGVAFQEADYGAPSLGTPESIASFDAMRVRAWHDEMLSGGRTTIIAVGDADAERLADAIAAVWEPGHPERSEGPWRTGEEVLRFAQDDRDQLAIIPGTRTERRDRKQSALAMLFPGPSRHDPERFAAETWGAIAAGLGGRLFESLRSKRSLAYTVIASSWQRKRAGGLLTYIATDPARLAEARDAMLEELDLFRREPPSADEVARATAALVGGVEMSRQTAGAYAGEIADAWLLGRGLADLEDPAAPYHAVTATDVHAVAARSLDPASRAEGVVEAVTLVTTAE